MPSVEDSDERDFETHYWEVAQGNAEQLGYATPRDTGRPLSRDRRAVLVTSRAQAAKELVVDVQQWLLDDDDTISELARKGLRDVLIRIYTGDQPRRRRAESATHLPDAILHALLPKSDPDGPAPWWHDERRQRRTRGTAIMLSLTFALACAWSIVNQPPAVALALLVVSGLLDIAEGAFSRAVHLRSTELRWASCVASQVGDIALIVGVALALSAQTPVPVAALTVVLCGLLSSLLGSFVRVSALQAGHRLWRSPLERILRYTAVTIFCVSSQWDHLAQGGVAVGVLVGGFGAWEIGRVMVAVLTGPAIQGGGIVFVDSNRELHEVAFADGEDGEESRNLLIPAQRPPARQ